MVFVFQAQHLQMLYNFFFFALLVIPFVSITCCGSKKEGGGGSKRSSNSRPHVSKKKLSDTKLSGSRKKSSEKVEKRRNSSKSDNTKPSAFKSKFDGVKTAVTMEPGQKKSVFPVTKHRKSSGKDEMTARSVSKTTTKSSAATFSKSAMVEAPSDMKSKMPPMKSEVKRGISQRRFKTLEEKIAATRKMLAYTGRNGPPTGNAMGNLDKQIETKVEGHLAVAFTADHTFDTPAYRYTTRAPKAGHVAKLNEAGNLLYLCDDVSKTKSASSSSSSKKKEVEISKSEIANTAEELNGIKKDEVDVNEVKEEDSEESLEE